MKSIPLTISLAIILDRIMEAKREGIFLTENGQGHQLALILQMFVKLWEAREFTPIVSFHPHNNPGK